MSAPATSRPGEVIENDLVAGGSGPSKRPRSHLLVDSLVTAVLGAIVFVIGFGGDLRRLAVPLDRGDLLPAYAVGKVWSEGAPFGNNAIGYPFGQELRYFATTEYLQDAFAGLISAPSHNPFVGINAVYALSFPLTALAALWVFRIVGVRGPIAIFTALAFTAIPFHWLRIQHIFLGTMYSAVLGVGLALLTGNGSIERRLADRRRWPTVALLAALFVVIGASGIYYACFTILLCSAALVYRLAHRPSWRGALLSAIPFLGVVVATAAALMPAWVFVSSHPALRTVANRQVIESVTYSGNLAFTLLPAPFTQIPGLRNLNPSIEHAFAEAVAARTSGVEWYANFGSLFTVLALALACVGWFWSVRSRAHGAGSHGPATEVPKPDTKVSFGLVGLLLATTVLFFVPWGLNVVFAALVTPQLRGWDRLVPILFLLIFAAAMVTWRSMGLPQKGARALLIATGCLGLLLFDSVLPHQARFAAAATRGQEALSYGEQYANALNAAIPGRCAMLQLPYQAYPETPKLHELPGSDPFLLTLTNPGKEWSFGAMKGTLGSEWQRVLASDIDKSTVSDLVAAGFCGIHVDRRGLTADEDVKLANRLKALLGAPVANGLGTVWVAYALPHAAPDKVVDVRSPADLPDRLATFFYPPTIAPRDGDASVGTRNDAFGTWWRANAEVTELTVHSLDPRAEFSRVAGTVRAGRCSPRDVTLELHSGAQTVTTRIHLKPGQARDFALRLASAATTAQLVVRAPRVPCTNPADQNGFAIDLLGVRAR